MKVWAYNIESGVRGEIIGEINCTGYGSYGFTLPKVNIVNPTPNTRNITVAVYAEDVYAGREVRAQYFGRDAVIFCTGEFRTGTDTAWEWVILVTPLEGESK